MEFISRGMIKMKESIILNCYVIISTIFLFFNESFEIIKKNFGFPGVKGFDLPHWADRQGNHAIRARR